MAERALLVRKPCCAVKIVTPAMFGQKEETRYTLKHVEALVVAHLEIHRYNRIEAGIEAAIEAGTKIEALPLTTCTSSEGIKRSEKKMLKPNVLTAYLY